MYIRGGLDWLRYKPFKCYDTITSIGNATFPNIYNKGEIDVFLANKANISNTYTMTQVDTLLNKWVK